jgi:hypothetical protein
MGLYKKEFNMRKLLILILGIILYLTINALVHAMPSMELRPIIITKPIIKGASFVVQSIPLTKEEYQAYKEGKYENLLP